mmetsp:Transcript_47545/g.146434  ORF Transcript_47545/g.146434 Transcript_47545/m.146434 type:complete len:396 (-) Transcript_47545:277-1464(-)
MGRHTPSFTNEAAMRSLARLALLTLAASLVFVCFSLVFAATLRRRRHSIPLFRSARSRFSTGLNASADGRNASEDASMHFIYTLGCNAYQLTQAVVLDHTWKEAGNVGRLTRIVVNCGDDAKSRALLDDSVLKHDHRFSIFFTEGDLMTVPVHGDTYPARGRPYAIIQWLEAAKPQEPLVAILDPDFVFIRPLSFHPDLPKVPPGRIFAQKYDLGLALMPGYAAANEPKPRVTFDEALNHWSTGPPWVLHTQDLRTMLPDWGRYTDKWGKDQGLLREQLSFIMAALKHNLSAMGQNGLTVSGTLAWSEAWSGTDSRPESWKPYILHYCQSYNYREWAFHKALIADNWYAPASATPCPGRSIVGRPCCRSRLLLPRQSQTGRSLCTRGCCGDSFRP